MRTIQLFRRAFGVVALATIERELTSYDEREAIRLSGLTNIREIQWGEDSATVFSNDGTSVRVLL